MSMPDVTPPSRPRGLPAGGGAVLVGLALVVLVVSAVAALRLASFRHLHIDESHNVFTMMLAMAWQDPSAGSPVELYHIVGGLLVRGMDGAADQYVLLRLVWGALFVVTAVAVGVARPLDGASVEPWPRAARVLVPASLAVTMAPWWRHGVEVRHDSILALGAVVLTGLCVRATARPLSTGHRVLAAAVAVVMQLDSHKAIILWGPAYLLLAWHESRHGDAPGTGRLRAFATTSVRLGLFGLVAGAVGLGVMGLFGCFGAYVERLAHFAKYAAGADRFPPWSLFAFVLERAPAVVALALLGAIAALVAAWRARGQGPAAVVDGLPPSVIMAVVAVLGLVVNPTPYPYNLTWLSPLIALAATDGLSAVLGRVGSRLHVMAVVVVMVPGVAALGATLRDPWSMTTMEHQRSIMTAAELLTAPDDTVLDGTGLVGTRRAPTRDWVLHSLMMQEYMDGGREHFDVVVRREHPAVVLTGNYRWRWLPSADLAAVQEGHVEVRHGVWVLGRELVDPVDVEVTIHRAGRYEITGGSVSIDGADRSGPVQLAAGPHRVSGRGPVRVAWLGPTLTSLEALPVIASRGTYRSSNMPGLKPPVVWRAGRLVSSSEGADEALPSAGAETR